MSLIDERADAFRVSRRVYADHDVHAAELERIFRSCWLFVAHEAPRSPSPGDYVTRVLGLDPVIVVRDERGDIQVLHNACRHRGRGEAVQVGDGQCLWTSGAATTGGRTPTTGNSSPRREVYDDDFDKSIRGLYRAGRVGIAHGLVFASWDPEILLVGDVVGSDRLLPRGDLRQVRPRPAADGTAGVHADAVQLEARDREPVRRRLPHADHPPDRLHVRTVRQTRGPDSVW